MEIKKKSPAGEEENKKQTEALKIKISGFLINYFNYFIFSLGVIILVVGLFLFVYPKYRQILKENQESKNNLQIEYEAEFNYLSSIRDLKKSYQSISDGEKAKIAVMVPAMDDASVIITEIESIAVRNSAILTSIKIEPRGSGDKAAPETQPKENKDMPAGIFNQLPSGVGLIKIEVNLSSVNYSILKNIVKAFENNLRLFDIARISFDSDKDQALLNIYSYYLLP
ncbi:MAG: hypothetical protein WCV70_04400 [Patescibacteria group bacterium]|jgi:hypothetical protein